MPVQNVLTGFATSFATQKDVITIDDDEDEIVELSAAGPSRAASQRPTINIDEEIAASLDAGELMELDSDYGLLAPEQQILFRVYSDDTDDTILDEIRPRYIVMYEPNQDFVRRIEV